MLRQVDWLDGDRRFPGEVRFVDARAIVRVEARTELKDRSRFDVRSYITSSARSAAQLAQTIRGHWGIENTLHWTLDVTFQEDLSRLRKGHGAQNMRRSGRRRAFCLWGASFLLRRPFFAAGA